MNHEKQRLAEDRDGSQKWRKWGPYLSERQWGTVREDYSEHGEAWEYVSHDASRSRAYRWGEDGIAGFCDDQQRLCFSVAFWNGKDPILKERMFGLTGNEGNHGEDVKEAYYYLDGTPTNSFLKSKRPCGRPHSLGQRPDVSHARIRYSIGNRHRIWLGLRSVCLSGCNIHIGDAEAGLIHGSGFVQNRRIAPW